jgi:hypothetical protein
MPYRLYQYYIPLMVSYPLHVFVPNMAFLLTQMTNDKALSDATAPPLSDEKILHTT